MLVRTLGKRTLGLGYAIALSDLVLAPFMPSATARSGGTIYPWSRISAALRFVSNGESAQDRCIPMLDCVRDGVCYEFHVCNSSPLICWLSS